MIKIEGSLHFFCCWKNCNVEHTFFSGMNKGSETEKGKEGGSRRVKEGSSFFTRFHVFLCFFVSFFKVAVCFHFLASYKKTITLVDCFFVTHSCPLLQEEGGGREGGRLWLIENMLRHRGKNAGVLLQFLSFLSDRCILLAYFIFASKKGTN